MGDTQKLLAEIGGRALIEWPVRAALDSRADPVVAVVRDRAGPLAERLPAEVVTIENPEADQGLSTSLLAGIRAAPPALDGIVVMLGDMPLVSSDDIDALIAAFRPGTVCVPTVDGRHGNPVLWSRDFFGQILQIDGDRGARGILEKHPERVIEVGVQHRGVLLDVDTPEALERIRALV